LPSRLVLCEAEVKAAQIGCLRARSGLQDELA
jgi:hypothetical protein